MARIPAGAVTTLTVTGDDVWAPSSLGLVRSIPPGTAAAIEPGRPAPRPPARRGRRRGLDGRLEPGLPGSTPRW